MRTLDRNRDYISFFPAGAVAFEQDGVKFDGTGHEVQAVGLAQPRRAAPPASTSGAPAAPAAAIPGPDMVAGLDWQALRNMAIALGIANVMNMKKADVEQAVRAKLAQIQGIVSPTPATSTPPATPPAEPSEAEKAA